MRLIPQLTLRAGDRSLHIEPEERKQMLQLSEKYKSKRRN